MSTLVASPAPLLDIPAPEPELDDVAPPTPVGRLGDWLLTVAALVGVAVLALTIGAHVSGFSPLVVRSGSMEPLIPTGGMVLVRSIPASEIDVGDVVAVNRADGTRVLHRVIAVELTGSTGTLTLKGDANEDRDPQPVVADEAGLLVWTVPSVGRVAAFLASAKGGFVLGCLITAVALTTLRRREE